MSLKPGGANLAHSDLASYGEPLMETGTDAGKAEFEGDWLRAGLPLFR